MIAATAVSQPVKSIHGILACPSCGSTPSWRTASLECPACHLSFPIVKGVTDLRPPGTRDRAETLDWSEHWSDDKQQSAAQRFFSFYRKAIFARTVAYFAGKYFPPAGVMVEAGSGTSETSQRIDKCGGRRTLVALDLIPSVLERCDPVMDIRICGDIFKLPFCSNSLDGVWNVGVMEHFTHDRIDAILCEFHRVLKPGGRVILLWPATFSIPQRMLRILEWFINVRGRQPKFRFHPDEISQIRSIREGREVLSRNRFRPIRIDPGVYSLAAFETLVGEKTL
jgi:SAM-dependent methyltransferase